MQSNLWAAQPSSIKQWFGLTPFFLNQLIQFDSQRDHLHVTMTHSRFSTWCLQFFDILLTKTHCSCYLQSQKSHLLVIAYSFYTIIRPMQPTLILSNSNLASRLFWEQDYCLYQSFQQYSQGHEIQSHKLSSI